MGAVRLTVGASADRSLGRVFDDWIAASARAKVAVAKNLSEGAAAGTAAAKQSAVGTSRIIELSQRLINRTIGQAEGAQAAAAARQTRVAERAAQAQVKIEQRAFDEKLRARQKLNADLERFYERETKAQERESQNQARLAKRSGASDLRDRQGTAGRVASGAYQTFAGVSRASLGVAGGIARGAGVDFDLGSAVGKSVSLESNVTGAVNSAAMARGETATQSDVNDVLGKVRAAGDATKLEYGKLAEGLNSFVAKSADLETGVAVLGDLGKIARASGSDVGQLVSSAGDVNKMLEQTPDKAERLLEIMRLVAKQGALGNVEIKDLAVFMGRITASSTQYEGTREKNIGTLGAMAQIAMKGGAVNAAEATNSTAAFARDITKGPALKRFEEEGIEIFSDESHTKLRSADKIIVDALEKTGGDLGKIASLFRNDVSKRVVRSLATNYNDAGGGAAGRAAVEAEFAKYTASMSVADVNGAAALSMDQKEAGVQAFNNQIERVGSALADRLMPAAEDLAPRMLELTAGFANVIAWAASNPGEAITVAIAGSIAKAALGDVISNAVKSQLSGNIGSGIAIAAAAITVTTVGMMLIDSVNDQKKEADAKTENAMLGAGEARIRARRSGETSGLEAMSAQLQARIAIAEGNDGTGSSTLDNILGVTLLNSLSGAANAVTGGSVGTSFDAQSMAEADKARLGDLKEQLAQNLAVLEAMKSGVQRVSVVDLPAGVTVGAGVDNTGRAGVQ